MIYFMTASLDQAARSPVPLHRVGGFSIPFRTPPSVTKVLTNAVNVGGLAEPSIPASDASTAQGDCPAGPAKH